MDKAPDNPIPTVVKLPGFTAPMVLMGFVVGDFINGEVTEGYGIGWVLGVVVLIDEVVFIKSRGNADATDCADMRDLAKYLGIDEKSKVEMITLSKKRFLIEVK